MEVISKAALGLFVVALLLLINGGYVYETKCPLASGGTQTSWSYGINDLIPYTRQTSEPCSAHTGTRLALSAVGIAPLGEDDESATSDDLPSEADQQAADSLRVATSAITAEYARQRSEISSITDGTLTQRERQKRAVSTLRGAIRRYEVIKTRLDAPVPGAGDASLLEARRLLSRWLGLQMEGLESISSDLGSADALKAKGEAQARKLLPVVERLETLSASIRVKYPEVSSWGFLRNA